MVTFTDQEIASLLQERKPLPTDWRRHTRMLPKRGHREQHVDITGDAGSEFRIILRESTTNPLDFSVILAVLVPRSNQVFRLYRYNGRRQEHTNHIEGESFYDFHIHRATERYQEIGTREDAYAEPTDRYSALHDALRCLLADASFEVPAEPQGDLFEEDRDAN